MNVTDCPKALDSDGKIAALNYVMPCVLNPSIKEGTGHWGTNEILIM